MTRRGHLFLNEIINAGDHSALFIMGSVVWGFNWATVYAFKELRQILLDVLDLYMLFGQLRIGEVYSEFLGSSTVKFSFFWLREWFIGNRVHDQFLLAIYFLGNRPFWTNNILGVVSVFKVVRLFIIGVCLFLYVEFFLVLICTWPLFSTCCRYEFNRVFRGYWIMWLFLPGGFRGLGWWSSSSNVVSFSNIDVFWSAYKSWWSVVGVVRSAS